MVKVKRGRITISANIILTALVITRGFSFGLIMISLYIKYGDDILDDDVIKIADLENAASMPLGTAVKSIVFSFIGVFVLELITGVCGMLGVLRHSKTMLSITVMMNSLMIVIYGIYIVIISIIYNKTYHLYKLKEYIDAAAAGRISYTYNTYTFPNFKRKLGCQSYEYYCKDVYADRVGTYMEAYFGMIVTCIICQVVSIIAVEYTYRKFEFKDNKSTISKNKYYLLLSLQYGIFRNFVIFIKKNWKRSKIIFISAAIKIASIFFAAGFIGLGLTLIGDVMIYDFYLRHIFRRIELYQYKFYDVLVGIAASAVVIGLFTMLNAIVGLIGSWRKSSVFFITSTGSSLVLTMIRIVAFLLWVVFMAKINNDMKFQLKLLQDGHYLNDEYNSITIYWNHMLLTLQCCGVDNINDTISSTHGSDFCCKNAHESIIDIRSTSSTNALIYVGCGGYNTLTCSESILFKTRMYIGWFLTLLLLQICLETVTVLLENQEYSIIFSIEKFKKTVVFREILDSIKLLFISNWKRSKVTCTSVGCILILSVGLLGLAINIRYDWIFGNGNIQDLFSQIYIENISLNSTIDYFSIVTVTFSAINILASIYSTISLVMVCGKWKYRSTILSLCLWSALVIASIIQLGLMAKVTAHINQTLEDTLHNDIMGYQFSNESAHHDTYSLYWNTLFIKAQCCGVGTSNVMSMTGSSWFASNRDSSYQQIPVQCCKSQTVVYPYASKTDTDCTDYTINGLYHTQGCDVAIQNQVEKYSIPFMVFTSIIIVAEICLIVQNVQSLIPSRKISNLEQQLVDTDRTIESNCATTPQSDRKHFDENVRYTEQTSTTKTETSVIKIESLNMANISSEENLTNSIVFKPTVSLDNETDENHENMQEQDQKIIDENNEITNVNSGYETNYQEGIKMASLEENTNVLSEEQISEKSKNTEI